MSNANKTQVNGTHYMTKAIQPWDFIAANGLGFFEGNIVKYVARWKSKGGIDDLRKARHYLDKLIELEVGKESADAKPSEWKTLNEIMQQGPEAEKRWAGEDRKWGDVK